ncbi:hypothetical protein [Mesorhizobium comanense]|uniref:hypothetical protein n=1 Tax=Mesorhizobium comanense TaxID=2502215 RepID=UPI0010F946EF|nr:hypothetical protein [Mesorhizobium comanense]
MLSRRGDASRSAGDHRWHDQPETIDRREEIKTWIWRLFIAIFWFADVGNVVETIKSGDGKLLDHSNVATLVAAMAGFDPATSPTGNGIQPNDPRLGDPNQTGTIAAAMQQTWMAA